LYNILYIFFALKIAVIELTIKIGPTELVPLVDEADLLYKFFESGQLPDNIK